MVNASRHELLNAAGLETLRLIMNKSLRGGGRESSHKAFYGFRRGDKDGQKKSRRFRRL
jgi:hypothetical protein